MRVLRIYPGANDPRHRHRELALARRGAEVGLVLPDTYGSDWSVAPVEPEIRHWRANLYNHTSIPLHLWAPSVLRRAVREFDPDVVDVHEEPYFPSGAQCVWAAGGRPLVLYSAQNLLKPLPPPLIALQRWVLSRAHALYPCSSGAAEVIRRRGFAGRVEVIPIGVDPMLFEVTPRGERIGFVGRFVATKGVRDLLQFGSRLLCVGDGPLADEIRAAGGEVRVARTSAELAAALSLMGVLVVPSRTTPTWKEQFGRAAAEAMAASVPVVAYASGSLPEVVGDAGVLVPEGDVAMLREAVLRVASNPGDLGRRGRVRALAYFNWDVIADRMLDLYRSASQGAGVN